MTKKLNEKNYQLLQDINDIETVYVLDGNEEAFNEHIKDAEAILLSTAYKMTREVIDNAKNLKVISRTGAGVDNVDVEAASEKGILVLNTPTANSISVAEHTITLILAITKQIIMYDSNLRDGNFKIRRSGKTRDIDGKTLGLIGCGRIGQFVANKCKAAFGMEVIGYDPYIKELPGILIYEDIEEVFKRADYISLHLPLTSETKNLVGERLLGLMKPTSYLVNTARGGIVDEYALAEKLKNEEIAGAALDVFETEPPGMDNPLLQLKNVILTPHSAALSKECYDRVAYEATLGIADYLKGNTPKFIVNKSIL